MFNRDIEIADSPFNLDGFMHLIGRHSAAVFAEKAYDAVRPPPRMAYPPPLKKVLTGKAETGGHLPGRQDKLLDDLRRLFRNSFIGVQHEDPGMPASINRKLFLTAKSTPRFVENLALELEGYP